MRTWLKEVDGIDWGDAALMNCRWRGPRLCDILNAAGVTADAQTGHVAFACRSTETQNDSWYGASVELERAVAKDRDIIVTLERNSEPLTPNHGAPARIIVPGVAGARSVEWVDRITVQQTESSNFYQNRDYKVLPEKVENADEAEEYWQQIPALQDMPVNSVITSPRSSDSITADDEGMITIRGYAVPGGCHGPIAKVDVSSDEQKTWTEATIHDCPGKWSWALWSIKLRADRGTKMRLFSRATDQSGDQQTAEPKWNLRGVAYNGYGESRNVTIL
ncbi:Oxidoreductase, molybdopterin-binding domain-containing protein [Xylariaceae sp. FL0016]|nr:Oxidoreductase, molybdopterin-binding domain-containing protein [Xylariaceae sp. FL0016]